MIGRLIAATGLALGALAVPAAAATLEPLEPCYVSAREEIEQREQVRVAGTEFAANSQVEILLDGQLAATTPTGTIGEFSGTIPAPYQADGERVFTLTVRDPFGNVETAQASVTALDVTLRPRRTAPWRKVRIRGRGFTAPGPVYGHYVFDGKVRKTVRLTRRTSPCGAFSVRRRQIPVRPRLGDWTLQVDQQRAYEAEPDTATWVEILIRVRNVFPDPDR
jgi:hypothetical protein